MQIIHNRYFVFSFLLLFILVSANRSYCQLRRMNVKVEKTFDRDFVFPENVYVSKKKNVGIAFSGGGSRSAAATLGQLRALNTLGLLDTVKYISCLSGSAWAAISYTYLPAQMNDTDFLGVYQDPKDLTWDDMTTTHYGSLAYNIAHSHTFPRVLLHWMRLEGDKKYSGVLNDIYLKRIDLGGRHKYFSYRDSTVIEIISHNIDLKSWDFYRVNPGNNRPYLIVNSTVVGSEKNSKGLSNNCFEITPLYSGAAYYNQDFKIPLGGGYWESFGLDNTRVNALRNNDRAVVKLQHKRQIFSLADAMALSGRTYYAREDVDKNYSHCMKIGLWSPYQYWDNDFYMKRTTEKFTMADGGDLDNLGIIALLKRKVDKIIVFVNSEQPISNNNTGALIDESITKLFGAFNNYTEAEMNKMALHVLKNDKGQLDTLKNRLMAMKRANESLIYTATYDVQENEKCGVYTSPGWNKVQITWAYNDNPQPFYTRLKDKDIREAHRLGKLNQKVKKKNRENNETGVFPFYVSAWSSKILKGLDYKNEHVNLMADFSAWVVMDNAAYFKKIVFGE